MDRAVGNDGAREPKGVDLMESLGARDENDVRLCKNRGEARIEGVDL